MTYLEAISRRDNTPGIHRIFHTQGDLLVPHIGHVHVDSVVGPEIKASYYPVDETLPIFFLLGGKLTPLHELARERGRYPLGISPAQLQVKIFNIRTRDILALTGHFTVAPEGPDPVRVPVPAPLPPDRHSFARALAESANARRELDSWARRATSEIKRYFGTHVEENH